MMLNSMTEDDAMRVLVMIQMAKDELFDDTMEQRGTPEANLIINRIKYGKT